MQEDLSSIKDISSRKAELNNIIKLLNMRAEYTVILLVSTSRKCVTRPCYRNKRIVF